MTRSAASTGLVGVVLVLVLESAAHAQGTPGSGMPPPTGPMGGQQEEEKKEGVAEAAPKTPGQLPTTPVMPAPKNARKRWKLFELDGYFRFRTDWFKNFHLGYIDDPAFGGSPFPRSVGCGAVAPETRPCEGNLSMANMRLKLMPTFNIDEGTSVFTEVDVLDNVVLGSTPEGQSLTGSDATPPLGAFGDGQTAPQAGVNSNKDSISIRRAWAEVALPLGILKFGRMPDHWGMGILANSGTEDTFNGGIDLDADYGDTVDRLSFSAIIPGTRLRGGIATDWVTTRLVSSQVSVGQARSGQPFDLGDDDDVNQWVITISQLDSPTVFKDAVGRGEFTYNWGIRFAYRTQKADYDTRGLSIGDNVDPLKLVQRDYTAYVPDVWLKAAYGKVQLELEAVGVLGTVKHLEDLDPAITEEVNIRQFGGVGRFTYFALDRKLRLGVEVGGATGDQWDNDPEGRTHITNANFIGGAGDNTLSRFVFDRDYKVDLILFRELLGAVSNAAYGKPFLSYDLTKSIMLKVSNVTAFAHKPVATPGNSSIYGTEFDADLGYSNNGFHAGIAYGVLFPLGAMDHPVGNGSGPGYPWTLETNSGDAGNAHTIQMRLALQF